MRRWCRGCGWRVRGWLGRRGFRVGIGLVWFVGRGGRGGGWVQKRSLCVILILFMGIGGIGWDGDKFVQSFILFFLSLLYSYIKRKLDSIALHLHTTYCSIKPYDPNPPPPFSSFLSFFLSPFSLPSPPGPHPHSLTHLLHPLHCKCSSTLSLASSSLQWLTCCFIPSSPPSPSSLLNSELSFHALGAFQLLLFFFFSPSPPTPPTPPPPPPCCCC